MGKEFKRILFAEGRHSEALFSIYKIPYNYGMFLNKDIKYIPVVLFTSRPARPAMLLPDFGIYVCTLEHHCQKTSWIMRDRAGEQIIGYRKAKFLAGSAWCER